MRPARPQTSLRICAYAQSDQSLCLSLEYSLTVKLLTEHHLEFLSLKGCCTGLSKSALVNIPHCWKSHAAAYFKLTYICAPDLLNLLNLLRISDEMLSKPHILPPFPNSFNNFNKYMSTHLRFSIYLKDSSKCHKMCY